MTPIPPTRLNLHQRAHDDPWYGRFSSGPANGAGWVSDSRVPASGICLLALAMEGFKFDVSVVHIAMYFPSLELGRSGQRKSTFFLPFRLSDRTQDLQLHALARNAIGYRHATFPTTHAHR